MKEKNNIQKTFLSKLCKTQQEVIVFLMNGFQMRGHVTGFDTLVVELVSDGKQQIIYKHAISTIVPERPVSLVE